MSFVVSIVSKTLKSFDGRIDLTVTAVAESVMGMLTLKSRDQNLKAGKLGDNALLGGAISSVKKLNLVGVNEGEETTFPTLFVPATREDPLFFSSDHSTGTLYSGRRSDDRGIGGGSGEFDGLNLIVIPFPVRNMELCREGRVFGLRASFFSLR